MTFTGSTASPEKSLNKWNTIIHMEDNSAKIWNISTIIYLHTTLREILTGDFSNEKPIKNFPPTIYLLCKENLM